MDRRPPRRSTLARRALLRFIRRRSAAFRTWAWRRTEPIRAALPPIAALAAIAILVPAALGVALLVLALVVRMRTGSFATSARAVRRFAPRLVDRVRPPYWWTLTALAISVNRWAEPPWAWPLMGG